MTSNSRFVFCISLIFAVVLMYPDVAGEVTVDEALSSLRNYRFGQNNDVLDTISQAATQSFDNPMMREKLARGLGEILESDAAYDAKQFACRQLSLVGTKHEVQALAKHLADDDLSHMALYALVHIPGQEVDMAILQALEKTTGRAQMGIIVALGNRRVAIAVDKLTGLLKSADKALASESARALGRIATHEAAKSLEETFNGRNTADDTVVDDAFLACADEMLARGDIDSASRVYRKVYASRDKNPIRSAALRGLSNSLGSKAIPEIIQALKTEDNILRTTAAQLARQMSGREVTEALAKALPELPPTSQRLLVIALGLRGDKAALPAVQKACTSPDNDVRIAALEALGLLGDVSSIRPLIEHAASGSDAEKHAAMASLKTLRGQDINKAIIAELKKADAGQQVQIVRILAERNAFEAVPVILTAVKTKAPEVRDASFTALSELAGQDEIPVLVDLLTQSQAKDMTQARKALVAVAHRCSAEPQASKSIIAGLSQIRDIEKRGALLQTLGDLGHDSGLSILHASLSDKDDNIQYAVITALSKWPNPEPMADLLKVAQTSDNKTHRVLALRGYVDLMAAATKLSPDQKLRCCKIAMEIADQDAEKKKILAVVSNIKITAAMEFAISHLANPTLKEEAALSAIAIAKDIHRRDSKEVAAAMNDVLSASVDDNFHQQARTILDEIEAINSYLTDWQVAGPYMLEGKTCTQLFDIPFGPELPDAQVSWRPIPVKKLEQHPAYLDLLEALNGGEQRVAYLRTQIESEDTRTASLEIFSDDGVKAWLNGQIVHANNVMRPIMADPDRIRITLTKGINHLMLKITQNNLPWGAIVRLYPDKPVVAKLGEGFRLHTINAESRFEAACIFDVNRDGKPDIFCGGFWYEAPSWNKHFVRDVPEEDNYYYDFANLPIDIDGDGWTDIINAAWHNKKLFWLRNPGSSGGPFEVIDIDTPGNIETALAVDINGDGRPDILPNIMGQAAWYEFSHDKTAQHGVKWTKHPLPKQAADHGIGAGDINGDGLCDIVTPTGWLEQTKNSDDKWQWHAEFNLGPASIPILVHDVDQDGDADIIWGLGHNYELSWMEQTWSDGKRSWQKHIIDKSWSQPHFMLLADLDNDGNQELVTGKRYYAHNGRDPGDNDPLRVYYYKFDPNERKWRRYTIHEGGRVGFGINTCAIDIDGDGDIDIVAPGKSGLYLFENLLK